MIRPSYCVYKDVPSCWECSLTNYGLDCHNKSIAHRDAGATRSERKASAARSNGKRGGRPKKSVSD